MIDQLPNAPETEQLVLASVFLDEALFPEIGVLDTSAFYSEKYRRAYGAMHNVAARSEPINPFTVGTELKKMFPKADTTIAEMTNWTYGVPQCSSVGVYVSLLKDKQLKRQIIRQCDSIARAAAAEDDLGTAIAGDAVSRFQDAYATSLETQKPTVHIADALAANYERWDKMLNGEIVTIETGLASVDNQLTGGGLEKGMFHIIGARPGKGKTSLGLDIAAHNAMQGKVVVFFTMELSREVLIDRFLAPLAGVPRYLIAPKYINDAVRKHLTSVGEALKGLPIYFNHKARTISDMRLALKDVARQTGGKIDLIVTDFLTKMRGRGTKYEAVSENANGLAEFAVEFNAASVALAQLNRGVAKRTADAPEEQGKVETTDFRDSGEIEELARTILALWGNDESSPLRTVSLSCIKQGEGSLFDEKVVFNTDFMTFGVRKDLTRKADTATAN